MVNITLSSYKLFHLMETQFPILESSCLCRYCDTGEPREVKFIDFQSARMSSLVTDLLTFTFTSLSSTLRREYVEQMLEVRRNINYCRVNMCS